jgi:double zinc ribbon protein
MTLITSDQDKFLRFLGKGSNKIERDRALAIIAEMRDDAGWVNFEDLTSRKPEHLLDMLDITEAEAHKVIGVATALYPPTNAPQTPTAPVPTLPTTLTLEMPGTTRCGNCSNVLTPGAEFCSRCGTPVASKLVCVKCGMQGGVGETFCLKDGIPLVPLVDALCISELMNGENMSITEATKTLQEMDAVRRSKLQEKAMQRGGGLFGGNCFLG